MQEHQVEYYTYPEIIREKLIFSAMILNVEYQM